MIRAVKSKVRGGFRTAAVDPMSKKGQKMPKKGTPECEGKTI
jgi:hypothetical protein